MRCCPTPHASPEQHAWCMAQCYTIQSAHVSVGQQRGCTVVCVCMCGSLGAFGAQAPGATRTSSWSPF